MLTYYSIAKENKPKIIAVLNEKINLLKTSKSLTQLKAIMEQGFLKSKDVIELINLAEDIIWQVHNPVIIRFTLYKFSFYLIFFAIEFLLNFLQKVHKSQHFHHHHQRKIYASKLYQRVEHFLSDF